MGKILLLVLSVVYLFVEYFFNVNLVSIVGTDTLSHYTNIDKVGRYISSSGAMLIVLRLIIISKKTDISKLFLTFFLLPITFISVYTAQEKAVDFIVNNTSQDVKKSQVYTYIFKKGLVNSSIDYTEIIPESKGKSIKDEVFITSISFWSFGYKDYIKLTEKEYNFDSKDSVNKLVNVFYNDILNNVDEYYNGYKKSGKYVDKIYKGYANLNRRYNEDMQDHSRNKFNNVWAEKEKGEKHLISRYKSIKRRYEKDIKNQVVSPSKNVYEKLYLFAGCSSESCWNSVSKTLAGTGYVIKKYCTISERRGRNVINVKSNHLNKNKIVRTSKLYKFSRMGSMTCNIDLREQESKNKNRILLNSKVKTGITDFSATKIRYFRNSRALRDAIINQAKFKGINLPSNWNINDKKTFKKAYLDNVMKKYKKEAKGQMLGRYHFSAPLGLSKENFYANKNVKIYLKQKMSFYYKDNYKNDLDKKDFFDAYKEQITKYLTTEYIKGLKDENFIDNIFKINIVPIIAITFSLIFGLINFVFITKECILKLIKNKRNQKEYVILIALFCFVFIFPLFINFGNIDHEHFNIIFNSFKDSNILGAYFYKWFISLEYILYSFSDILYFEIPFEQKM